MKTLAKAGATVGLITAVVLGGGTIANATTAYPEGGTCNYGVRWVGGSNDQAYSEYDHAKRSHKASACSTAGCAKTDWISAGKRAAASRSAGSLGNTPYYDVR